MMGNIEKKKILIIDDDEYVQEILSYILGQNKKYEIIVSNDGSKAMGLIEEEAPDLIFLDCMLPGIDGIEINKRLKNDEKAKNIPVVLMSASLKKTQLAKSQFSADFVVSKPFNMTEILEIVEKCLGK
jgi:CheY-like chemotaxis protein